MGMVVIDGIYFVEVESRCLTLKKVGKVRRDGKRDDEIFGYFNTWEGLFDKLLKLFVSENIEAEGEVTLSELKQIYCNARVEIREMLKVFLTSDKECQGGVNAK